MSQQQQLAAPVLTRGDIVKCLGEMGIGVSPEQLAKPTSALMSSVYRQFVELLTPFDQNTAGQANIMAADEIMEYPELHEDSIPELAFHRALLDLMERVQAHNFTLSDIFRPTPRRTAEHLSAVINFAKFREGRIGQYEELTTQTADLEERMAHAVEEREQLSAVRRKLRAQLERDEPEVERLTAEASEKQATLEALNKEQAEIRADSEATKAKLSEAKSRFDNAQFAIVSTRQEIARLKAQIVQSPEKLQQTLKDLAEQIDTERAKLKEAEHKSLDLRAKSEALSRVEKDVSKVLTAMDECSAERDAKKAVKEEKREVEEEISSKDKELRDLSTEEQVLETKLGGINERIGRAQKQYKLKETAVLQTLSGAKSEHAAVKRGAIAAQQQVDKENAATEDVRAELARSEKNHNAEIAGIREQITTVENQIEKYHAALFSALEGNSPETPAKA